MSSRGRAPCRPPPSRTISTMQHRSPPSLSCWHCSHHLVAWYRLASQVALETLALPAAVAQGQGSRDAGSMSGQCLLQLLHMDSGIHYVHALMSLWPAMLVAPWTASKVSAVPERRNLFEGCLEPLFHRISGSPCRDEGRLARSRGWKQRLPASLHPRIRKVSCLHSPFAASACAIKSRCQGTSCISGCGLNLMRTRPSACLARKSHRYEMTG